MGKVSGMLGRDIDCSEMRHLSVLSTFSEPRNCNLNICKNIALKYISGGRLGKGRKDRV